LLLGCEDVPWADAKIGGGAPPVKTDKGWLLIFHAVDMDESRSVKTLASNNWIKRYTAGAALYDLEDPTKLIAITQIFHT
jgi:beta-1,4-mannooligosaccharide/beta-1,4-mannosyl-N-acetylglucosamine phosphorylase